MTSCVQRQLLRAHSVIFIHCSQGPLHDTKALNARSNSCRCSDACLHPDASLLPATHIRLFFAVKASRRRVQPCKLPVTIDNPPCRSKSPITPHALGASPHQQGSQVSSQLCLFRMACCRFWTAASLLLPPASSPSLRPHPSAAALRRPRLRRLRWRFCGRRCCALRQVRNYVYRASTALLMLFQRAAGPLTAMQQTPQEYPPYGSQPGWLLGVAVGAPEGHSNSASSRNLCLGSCINSGAGSAAEHHGRHAGGGVARAT